MTRTWSKYQNDVFEFVLSGQGNGLINAMPGSGKTTVLEECVRRIPYGKSILAITFTCLARDQLKAKLGDSNPFLQVSNLNGFGNSCIPGWKKVNKRKVTNLFYYEVINKDNRLFAKYGNTIDRLIGLLKSQMVFTRDDFLKNWRSVADQYDVAIPDEPEFQTYLDLVFTLDRKPGKVINFDDQIAIPIRDNLPTPYFDFVLVDEAQDLSPCQIELTKRAIKPKGRALYVGDRYQSIYMFRGADSKAMDNISLMLTCQEYPLNVCYRCSKAVVRAAKQVVDCIEPHEDAVEGFEGIITNDDFKLKVQAGDYVLCRTTAPLVAQCLSFIRGGIKALVKGREIGEDLAKLVNTLSDNATIDLESFRENLQSYLAERMSKVTNDEKLIAIADKVDTIEALCEEADDVQDVLTKIDNIFTDQDDASIITLMTGHKAKGLETENVFILRPDLLPHKMAKSEEAQTQERNLKFVMITRAKVNLYWVEGHKNALVH